MLTADERASIQPVSLIPGANLEWLIVCDHASNSVPPSLDALGLDPVDLQAHIAYDIGAAWASRRLAEQLDAPLVLCNYSRLIIDCNRYPSAVDSVPRVSHGRPIPMNSRLTGHDLDERREWLFRPYHSAIDAALRRADTLGKTPAFLSIHSCTPILEGRHRPWHIGVCWTRDERMSAPVIENLQRMDGVNVGDNEPYSLDIGADYTTVEHAMTRGLAHLQVEFRQDLIQTPEAAAAWADRLYTAISAVEYRQDWHRREFHLSAADGIQGFRADG